MIPPRRRILMVIPQLGYGGAETAFLRLAGYLAREDVVTIALMARDYGVGNYSTAQAATDLPIEILDGGRIFPGGPIGKIRRWIVMRRRLAALKRDHDVAISFMSGANLLNALSGRRERTIVSERGSKRFDAGTRPLQRWFWTRVLDRISYRGAAAIVAASEGLAGEIRDGNPESARKILALEGLVHADRLVAHADADLPPEFAAFHGYETVVAFGRMHVQKGFDCLIGIFARIRSRRPAARLLLIGDGPEMAGYIDLVHRVGLRAGTDVDPDALDVIFAGYRDNPLAYLRLGRVFSMTSRYEGLPNALIEALASGIPVLASDCPWGPRSILAGLEDEALLQGARLPLALTHGTLMPLPDMPEGAEAWEREIDAALEHPVPRKSRELRMAAIARFDIGATGPAWKVLVHKLIEGK